MTAECKRLRTEESTPVKVIGCQAKHSIQNAALKIPTKTKRCKQKMMQKA